jgi:phosphoribosylanthranilate isomerase
MTWVKICGITNLDDARAAVEAGADALGFVFYEKSPRNIEFDRAREIVSSLNGDVETVGVFVNQDPGKMIEVAHKLGLKAVQLHRTNLFHQDQRGVAGVSADDIKVYFVFPASGFRWPSEPGSTDRSGIAGIFLDSGTEQQPGGTGNTFDWKEARRLVSAMSQDVNVIVAGGLTPENVAGAIEMLHPYGVDVSSGVEAKPGKKDSQRVRAFIRAVRQADETA